MAERKKIGRAILAEVGSVKAVYEQLGGIEGEFRLRKLRHLAGEKRTTTIHRENGCSLQVDVAKCYYSPRLSTERLRIAELAETGEKVLNMFAGVGPYSILLAKRKRVRVLSCELNDYACRLHEINDVMNKVDGLVKVVNCDALVIPKLTKRRFDRILMPHPSGANLYLPTALQLARKGGVIHYYRHVLGSDENEATKNLHTELKALIPQKATYDVRRVRLVGPRWVELVADIHLP